MDLLNLTGAIFEIVGVVLAGYGLWRTWHEFAAGERFWEPVAGAARAIAHRLAEAARKAHRKLLRRPAVAVTGTGHMVAGAGMVSARGRVAFRTMPRYMDSKTAIAELDGRTRRLMDELSEVSERLSDETERAAREEVGYRQLDQVTALLAAQDRQVAIGGVRIEATGLFCIALGLGLRMLAGL